MGIAGVANRFNPLKEARAVETIGDRIGLEWLGERRPTYSRRKQAAHF
jgi:hypothetical protein